MTGSFGSKNGIAKSISRTENRSLFFIEGGENNFVIKAGYTVQDVVPHYRNFITNA
jgi:hypothetical protein